MEHAINNSFFLSSLISFFSIYKQFCLSRVDAELKCHCSARGFIGLTEWFSEDAGF